MVRSAIPILGAAGRMTVHHREAPTTLEEIEIERMYCENLQREMIAYERDPRNFFKLRKLGTGRKI